MTYKFVIPFLFGNFRPAYFKIIEECVSQIVLHKSGLDPDFKKNHVDLDLQPLMEELKGTSQMAPLVF